jgi:hypothetical protein
LGVGVTPSASKLQVGLSAVAAVPAAGATGHNFAFGSTSYGIAGGALTSGNSYIQATRWDGTATNYDLLLQPNGGNVGVGVSPTNKFEVKVSPASASFDGLRVSDSTRVVLAGQTGATYNYLGIGANQNMIYASGGRLDVVADSQLLYLRTGTSAYAVLDTSGNVGVGVTPSAWLIGKVIQIGATSGAFFYGAGGQCISGVNAYYDTGWKYAANGFANYYQQSSGNHTWYNAPSGTANNAITWTQAMTLDASGNLLVGTTSTSNTTQGFKILSTGRFYGVMATGGYAIMNHTGGSGTEYIYEFQRAGTAVGSITTTTTSTAYVTSSDYRLKESVAPLSGGLARVNALKPSIYKWKSDGSSGEGFLAHELAEVVPSAVTGEKDAVNEDGSIKAQGVDLSKVVPILVAAIKELTARVEALEA